MSGCAKASGFLLFLIGMVATGGAAPVGFRIVAIQGRLKTAVWYPTSGKETHFNYSKDLSGSVAREGPVTGNGLPLIVFSHGFGGCGIQSVFITEELARRGFVVAAPDHRDASCSVDGTGKFRLQASQRSFFKPDQWTDATHRDRKDDVQAVIEWALSDSEFRHHIDPDRIGGAGHSLGGYTMLGLAGAWPSWRDRRIKAVLLLSPYLLPYLVKNRLGDVDIPLMYQGSEFDITITPSLKGSKGALAAAKSEAYLVELKAGSHFEWTNALCAKQNDPAECLSKKRNAQLIVQFGATFLQRFVNREHADVSQLDKSGLAAFQTSRSTK